MTLRVAVLLLSSVLLTACSREAKYEKPATPVAVHKVERFRSEEGLRYSANVQPFAEVTLAFKTPGYVEEILQVRGADGRMRNLQDGDRVNAGMRLARVRQGEYLERLEQSRSQLAEATAGWEQAQLAFERASRLFAEQSLTKSEYDRDKAQFDAGQARRKGAAAILHEAEIALSDTELRAPIRGVVMKRMIEVGSLVGAGTPGFVIANTSAMKVVFGVPDVMVAKTKLGEALPIAAEALGATVLSGRVTRVSPSADARTRLFDVEVTVPNPQDRLKVGMIASLQMPTAPLSGMTTVVPLASVVRPANSSSYAVFVVEDRAGTQIARMRPIKLGEALGNMFAVTEGVRIGEQVIVTGATLVSDGEPVRVIPQ